MSFVEHIMLGFAVIVSAFYLIAGGVVSIRNYIRSRGIKKAEAFAAKVKAAIEAKVAE